MNHIDEATIHAWLDSAVDATQSREIEAHVAECSTCASAVAEARGFVAASSRILNALDDVPAGVTPKRAPSLPQTAPRKRQWRAAPWVTGIAAALMLAVGVTTWNRRAVEKEMRSVPASAVASQPVESLPPAVVVAPQRDASTAAPVSAPAAAPEEKRLRRDAAPKSKSRAQLADAQPRSVGAAAGAPTRERSARGVVGGAGVAVSRDQKVENVASAAPSALVAPRPTADMAKLIPTPAEQRAYLPTDIEELSGCYRTGETRPRGVAVPLGEALPDKAALRRRANAAAPAPAQAEYAGARPPAMMRLDTARHPLGYAVRSATSDSVIGSWRQINGDTARVDLLAAGQFTFARKDRIACPDR
ncbi:MAG TPA: zf-HC2 domain-containing protein [Gemmatimonadaceae bacterium]